MIPGGGRASPGLLLQLGSILPALGEEKNDPNKLQLVFSLQNPQGWAGSLTYHEPSVVINKPYGKEGTLTLFKYNIVEQRRVILVDEKAAISISLIPFFCPPQKF